MMGEKILAHDFSNFVSKTWHGDDLSGSLLINFLCYNITETNHWLPIELSALTSFAFNRSCHLHYVAMDAVNFVHEVSAQCR